MKIGLYNTKFKVSADYDFFHRAYTKKIEFIFIDKIITWFRASGVTSDLTNFNIKGKYEGLFIKKNKIYALYDLLINLLKYLLLLFFRDKIIKLRKKKIKRMFEQYE
jgi:hypothetical protein